MAGQGRGAEAVNIVTQALQREQRRLRSLSRFVDLEGELHAGSPFVESLREDLARAAKGLLDAIPPSRADSPSSGAPSADARVPTRSPEVKGPLAPDGDWVLEKAGADAARISITRVPRSDDVTYEVVNFIDGTRTVSEIRDAVSAEFEPVDLAAVSEYLDVLARAGAVTFRR